MCGLVCTWMHTMDWTTPGTVLGDPIQSTYLSIYPPQQQSPPQVLIVHDKVGDVRAYPATKEGLDK